MWPIEAAVAWYVCSLHRGSSRSLARAMDGRILRCGIMPTSCHSFDCIVLLVTRVSSAVGLDVDCTQATSTAQQSAEIPPPDPSLVASQLHKASLDACGVTLERIGAATRFPRPRERVTDFVFYVVVVVC